MKLRSCVFIVLAGIAVPSFASFELLMALDSTDKVVHRYDSESGTYLGALGGGYIQNPISMAIDQDTNTAYILQDSSTVPTYVTKLNYNTGEFLGNVFFPDISLGSVVRNFGLNGPDFLLTYVGGDVERYSAAGVFQGFLSGGAPSQSYGAAKIASGAVVAQYGDGVLRGWSSSTTSGTPVFTVGSAGSAVARGQVATRGQDFASALSSNLYYFGRVGTNNLGTTFSTSGIAASVSGTKGVAIGHNDAIYLCGQDASLTSRGIIQRMHGPTGINMGTFGTGQLKTPIAMAIVVAPEPGTLIALGAGAIALLRKRRRKN